MSEESTKPATAPAVASSDWLALLKAKLTEREWKIVQTVGETDSLAETSRRLKVTKGRIRQILRKCRRVWANDQAEARRERD